MLVDRTPRAPKTPLRELAQSGMLDTRSECSTSRIFRSGRALPTQRKTRRSA